MRGKGNPSPISHSQKRITPAYAGKSPSARFRVHIDLGSPPRMRGKVDCIRSCIWIPRITPAYAGKRQPPKRCTASTRDHPRVCGEKENSMTLKDYHKGSPPRMRGKGSRRYGQQWSAGITPAYAGKSASCTQSRLYRWDHPRVCGEKKRSKRQHRNTAGSPPRMRGKGA